MDDKKPNRRASEQEVYAECRKTDRDFPVGWNFMEAMAFLQTTRTKLEREPVKEQMN